MVIPDTVLSVRPPTLPMERPWPPEQDPPVKVIPYMLLARYSRGRWPTELTVPELIAKQSS
jgi:hypothetical protein